MAIFYGAYLALTGIFVTLSLAVKLAEHHRVFFTILDVSVIAYVCLLNTWFRNALLGWTSNLSKEVHD